MTPLNIVFVHGWLFDNKAWNGFEKLFPIEFKTTLINLPGYGDSTSMRVKHTNYLENYLRKLSGDTIIIGWSHGGALAIQEASRNHPNVKKIVAINANLSIPINKSDKYVNKMSIEKLKKNLIQNKEKTIKSFILESVKHSSSKKTEFKALLKMFPLDSIPSIDVLTNHLIDISKTDLTENLKYIKKDILLINGKLDQFMAQNDYENYSNIYTQLIEGMPHFPFISYKKELYKLITNFI